MLLIICGVTHTPLTLPSSSFSILEGAISVLISTPSASAPEISSERAVISATLLLYTMLTFFAPNLTDVRTASIDTFPPPITATSLPSKLSCVPYPTFLKNCTAEITPLASSPSSPNFLSVLAPIVINTASYFSFKSTME